MTNQQAIEYFFTRIRKQILAALANRKMCEDLHLMGKLSLFEKDRKEAVGKDKLYDQILVTTIYLYLCFSIHSLASFCASVIWAGVIFSAALSIIKFAIKYKDLSPLSLLVAPETILMPMAMNGGK